MKKGKRWVPEEGEMYWALVISGDYINIEQVKRMSYQRQQDPPNAFRLKGDAEAARKRVLKALKGE